MLDNAWVDLSKHRLATSLDDYNAALELVDTGHFKAANNRAYYSIFYSIRAVLALEGKDFKKHSALISYFNQNYIHNGPFTKEHSKIIARASMIRNSSDYDDFYVADKEETLTQIGAAKSFYDAVQEYINALIAESEKEFENPDSCAFY